MGAALASLSNRLFAGLRRLAVLAVAVALCASLVACGGGSRTLPSISPEDMAVISRQAEGFLAAKARLPELASLVNERDWTFTRNLIHGPMQEVGRQMLYINQRLLPADRAAAEQRASQLKNALADLDEAARLQNAEGLRKGYIQVASGFGAYLESIPAEALAAATAEPAASADVVAPEEPGGDEAA